MSLVSVFFTSVPFHGTVPVRFVMAVTAAAGFPAGIFVLVMFVISVCLMSMFVMSAAAFLMPVSSAGDAVPRFPAFILVDDKNNDFFRQFNGTDPANALGCAEEESDIPQHIIPIYRNPVLDRDERGALNVVSGILTTVESFGMICAEDEIGVGKSHDGIIVLPPETAVGTLAKDYYRVETDTVIEVDITPNRSDAISHYGVARDLYAYCFAHGIAAELRRPQLDESIVALKGNNNPKIEVRVDNSDACPRYAGISLTGVGVDQSPQWLQNRLLAIGLSPINNVVDITNYMLHYYEIGRASCRERV